MLGAEEGIAQIAQERINQKVGREIIISCYSPQFGFEKNEEECHKIIKLIERSGANVLAVGLGSPKQEKWLVKYKNYFKNIKIFFAIGATIDFEAGHKPRAPKWVSEVGLEWLYRLLCEPKRLWKRYLIEFLPFLWLIVKQKFENKISSPLVSFISLHKKLSNLK